MEMVNLHCHSDLGSFDSILTPKQFVKRLTDLNQKYLVQTDHGTLRGMVKISEEAKKAGISYVPGLEVYLTLGATPTKEKDEFNRLYYHMLLIAKNKVGLNNLFKLIALSYKADHYYYKPRVSLHEVFDHADGLIATTGCLASLTSNTILAEARGLESLTANQKFALGYCDDHCNIDHQHITIDQSLRGYRKVDVLIKDLQNRFKDDLYLEVQDCGSKDQGIVNAALFELGKQYSIPIVATSDAHYATPDQASLRTMMLKIRHGKDTTVNEGDSEFYEEGRLHLKSGEELSLLFGEEPIKNTMDLIAKCELDLLNKKTLFPVPLNTPDMPEKEYLLQLSLAGLKEKIEKGIIPANEEQKYKDRIHYELEVINELGFTSYFLVLIEILDWCRDRNILYGRGRGSACGSLICYLTKITGVDPLIYGLYFSRFLNKSRVSPPDIDLDCPKDRRDEIIEYIISKYGEDKVCQIMTFSAMKPRGMARDVGRAIGEDELGIEISKLIPPALHGFEPTVTSSLEEVPELLLPKYDKVVSVMKRIEGLNRSIGCHASGIVISPVPLTDLMPIEYQREKEIEKPVCQIGMDEVEKIGLIKMDFLGLRNLSIIAKCLELVNLSIDDISIDDKTTFQALCTTPDMGGIFQFEGSPGISKLLQSIQPTKIEDISDATSIFRPGPLMVGLDKLYIKNRNNKEWTPVSLVEKLTSQTYGCMIYQEDLMRMCVQVAGFDEVSADSIRRGIGKKKKEEIDKWKLPFVDGCKKTSNLSEQEAVSLFNNIEAASSYGFNLAHSVLK